MPRRSVAVLAALAALAAWYEPRPVPPIDDPAVAPWRPAAGAAPMDEFSPPVEGRPACLVTISIQNDTRRVLGGISQECTRGWHTVPFGNRGVDSERGRRHNGNQFAGWKRFGKSRQWNSCPGRFRPPDRDHYNDNGFTTQKAAPDDVNRHAIYYQWGRHEEPCSRRADRTYVHRNPYMKLYELDWPDSDDHVTTLRFSTLTVPITCSNDWQCGGQSHWRPSHRNSKVSARIRVTVDMGRNS